MKTTTLSTLAWAALAVSACAAHPPPSDTPRMMEDSKSKPTPSASATAASQHEASSHSDATATSLDSTPATLPAAGAEVDLAEWCGKNRTPGRCREVGPVCGEVLYDGQAILDDAKDPCRYCDSWRSPRVVAGGCDPIREARRRAAHLEPWAQPKKVASKLCERENPRFDARLACIAVGQKKFPGRTCTAKLGPTTFKPQGSCRPCVASCR